MRPYHVFIAGGGVVLGWLGWQLWKASTASAAPQNTDTPTPQPAAPKGPSLPEGDPMAGFVRQITSASEAYAALATNPAAQQAAGNVFKSSVEFITGAFGSTSAAGSEVEQ